MISSRLAFFKKDLLEWFGVRRDVLNQPLGHSVQI